MATQVQEGVVEGSTDQMQAMHESAQMLLQVSMNPAAGAPASAEGAPVAEGVEAVGEEAIAVGEGVPLAGAAVVINGTGEEGQEFVGEGGDVKMPMYMMTSAMSGVAPGAQINGERKRVRSACVSCHERKLRCVMLPSGSCQQCTNKGRPCVPRVEKKRGRPRSAYVEYGVQPMIGLMPAGFAPQTSGSPSSSGNQQQFATGFMMPNGQMMVGQYPGVGAMPMPVMMMPVPAQGGFPQVMMAGSGSPTPEGEAPAADATVEAVAEGEVAVAEIGADAPVAEATAAPAQEAGSPSSAAPVANASPGTMPMPAAMAMPGMPANMMAAMPANMMAMFGNRMAMNQQQAVLGQAMVAAASQAGAAAGQPMSGETAQAMVAAAGEAMAAVAQEAMANAARQAVATSMGPDGAQAVELEGEAVVAAEGVPEGGEAAPPPDADAVADTFTLDPKESLELPHAQPTEPPPLVAIEAADALVCPAEEIGAHIGAQIE